MHPILFNIGPLSIYSYGVMIALAFVAGIYFSRNQAKKEGIDATLITEISLYLLVGGIIGARLLYVFTNFTYYLEHPFKIFFSRGGFVFYGGLIGATITGMWYLKRKQLSLFKIADIIIPSVALGEAIGRIGCLLYGCCYGRPTSLLWGISFGVDSPAGIYVERLHPTQIYSSLICLVIFLYLNNLSSKKKFRGQIFLAYLILLSAYRFMMEFLRGDTTLISWCGNLTLCQCISGLIFLGSILVYLYLSRGTVHRAST